MKGLTIFVSVMTHIFLISEATVHIFLIREAKVFIFKDTDDWLLPI